MQQELRCATKLHGVLPEPHTLEVSCGSKFCGKAPGVVVIHRFNLLTGECSTRLFRQPPPDKER